MSFNPSSLIAKAEKLARRLHAAQTDAHGRPYVEHLEAVVAILMRRWPDAPEEAVAAAWLHDALELSTANWFPVRELSFDVSRLVAVLTRCSEDVYADYIASLATCSLLWAIRIKLADLEHNSDSARAIPGSDIVERRYAPARVVLERALEGRG